MNFDSPNSLARLELAKLTLWVAFSELCTFAISFGCLAACSFVTPTQFVHFIHLTTLMVSWFSVCLGIYALHISNSRISYSSDFASTTEEDLTRDFDHMLDPSLADVCSPVESVGIDGVSHKIPHTDDFVPSLFLSPLSGSDDEEFSLPEYQDLTLSTTTLIHMCNFIAFLHILVNMISDRKKMKTSAVSCLVFLYANTLPIAGIRVVLESAAQSFLSDGGYCKKAYAIPSRGWIMLADFFGPILRRINGYLFGSVDFLNGELCRSFTNFVVDTNLHDSSEGGADEGDYQSISDVHERIAFIRKNWRDVYTSDVLFRLRQFIGYVAGYVFCYSNPGVEVSTPRAFAMWGIEAQQGTPMTIFDCVLSTAELVAKNCETYSVSGDFRDLYSTSHELRELEAKLADIEGNIAALELGNYDMTPFSTSEEVLANIEEIIQDLRGRQATEHVRSVRLWLDSKLAKSQELFIRLLKSSTGNSMREAPYAILLYGASSVGKSTVANQLMKCLLAACGHASTSRHVTVLNLADKFQSDYRPQHSGIILDDIANAKAERSDINHTQMIIDLINNVPKAALQAEVEKKGLVMLTPKIVIGTTNVKDVQAGVYSNEPFSIVRRFAYTLTVAVRPEFSNKDGTLDSASVPAGGAVDVWNIKVERAVGRTCGGRRTFVYEDVLEGSFAEVAKFLCSEAKGHVKRQRNLVDSSAELFESDLCEHNLFSNICDQCGVVDGEHQSGVLQNILYWRILLAFFSLRPFYDISLYVFLQYSIFNKFLLSFVCSFLMMLFYKCSVFALNLIAVYMWLQFLHYVYMCIVFYRVRNAQRKASDIWRERFGTFCGALREHRRPLFFLGLTLPAVLAIIGLCRMVGGQFQAFSAGADPQPDDVPKENVWQKVMRRPMPVSESAKTTSFAALMRMCSRSVRLAVVNSQQITHLFPICGDMWVMNAHVWLDKGDHIVMRVLRGDIDSNANIQDLILHRSEVHFEHGRDLAFFRFRSAGSVKDFRPWLLKDIDLRALGNINGRIPARRQDGQTTSTNFGKTQIVAQYRVNTDIFRDVVVAHVPDHTWNGMCGAPWVADTRAPCIMGIHFAGKGPQGACMHLTLGDAERAISALAEKTTGVMLQSSGTLPTEICGRQFGPLGEAHVKSPTQFLSERAKLEYFGSHTLPRRTFRSKVEPSLISTTVADVMEVENKHGPPKDMNHYRHFQKHLEAVTHTNDYFHPQHLAEAENDLLRAVDKVCEDHPEQLDKVRPLSETAILSGIMGVRGLDRLDQSTSAGWPLNKPKENWIHSISPATADANEVLELDPVIREEVARIEACAVKGERSYAIFRANLKDEPTKLTKDKVRVFAGAPLAHSFLIRKYFLMVIIFIQTHPISFECAVGTDAHGPEWNILMKHLRKFGSERGIAGDYKAYDTTISATMLASVYKVLLHIILRANERHGSFSDDDILVVKSLITDLCQPCYEHNGDILGVVGSNPSGHNLTVIVNNIANSLYMRYTYYVLADCEGITPKPFKENVALLCYGDDNIMGVSEDTPWFNHTNIADTLSMSGVVYTMADKEAESVPYVNLDDLSFLKRGARFEEDLGAFLAPIEMDSIFKSLHNRVVNRTSCSAREHAGAAISAACTEFFLHGREVYEKRVPQLLEIVEKHDLSNQVFDVTDYDAKLALYREKYC